MTPIRRRVALAAVMALIAVTTACGFGSSDSGSSADRPSSSSPSPTRTTAPPPPAPPTKGACYRLSYRQALAPTDRHGAVACEAGHTSQTYRVGHLKTVVDGHLVAVDSHTVQHQVADRCPAKLATYLGATPDQLRLSLLRAVWFTPTVAESDAGASWYRCDVIAVTGDQRLAALTADLRGALSSAKGREQFAMCATDQPGTADFQRVLCREQHSWKAISTVDLSERGKDGAYPGESDVRGAGDNVCADAARAIAPDSLDYTWGYEWPTRDQWDAGQTYGRCWAPD